jgi:hypothetical protein
MTQHTCIRAVAIVAGLTTGVASAPSRQTSAPAPPRGSPSPAATVPRQESIQEANDRLVKELTAKLGDRGQQPSRVVFKNIKLAWFKETPAEQLLDIMNGGYAKALGVRCTFCHVADDFASDQKRPKQAAREMAAMHWDINQRLGAMRHLKDAPEDRFINCATCHRGKRDPHDT